ncbi:MAG: glutathione S-transferase N-terminal domain-containing protein [Methylophilaceae bacterium]|jgi:glutathione S-transferase|nr:glutathione S-transferase N-terminal domain-containing protein [Methylophilaceae bacterium]MDG1452873.1 glutathione S-transferase N-terminal domain-containing protein [Methylophilaceae bacterium]
MKLLYTPNSPYARKVRIVAIEKHIELELQEVVLGDPDSPVTHYNPLGKVPTIVFDDETALYDSRVIVEYLSARTPVNHLLPSEHKLKVEVLRWEALADGVCDAAVAIILEQRKPEAQQSEAVLTKQRLKVEAGLAALNKDISKKKWCVNETFSLADISVGCLLGYIDLRLKQLNWQDQYPNLAKHFTILSMRPSFKDTMPIPN